MIYVYVNQKIYHDFGNNRDAFILNHIRWKITHQYHNKGIS
jgi:hypothetical protein